MSRKLQAALNKDALRKLSQQLAADELDDSPTKREALSHTPVKRAYDLETADLTTPPKQIKGDIGTPSPNLSHGFAHEVELSAHGSTPKGAKGAPILNSLTMNASNRRYGLKEKYSPLKPGGKIYKRSPLKGVKRKKGRQIRGVPETEPEHEQETLIPEHETLIPEHETLTQPVPTQRNLITSSNPRPPDIPSKMPEICIRTAKSGKRGRQGYSLDFRERILSAYEYFALRGVYNPIRETANCLQVSEFIVRELMKLSGHVANCDKINEPTCSGRVCPCTMANDKPRVKPNEKSDRPRKGSWREKLDSFDFRDIRRIIHRFWKKDRSPNLNDILCAVKEKIDHFTFGQTVLHEIMKQQLGMKYVMRRNRRIVFDRPDLSIWRSKYLREIKKYRDQNRQIVYLDETWVVAMMVSKCAWYDDQVMTIPELRKEAMRVGSDFTLNLGGPTSRGTRAIVLHAMTEKGFVPNCSLIFKSKGGGKSADYHGDMNYDVFKSWFEHQLIPNLHEPSVIVMDNAPYHCKSSNRAPPMSSTIVAKKNWLTKNGIPFNDKDKKEQLQGLIKKHRALLVRYDIDEYAKANGHRVLRLPPYHCMLNPIENVWSTMKSRVQKGNTKFTTQYKLDAVMELTETVFAELDSEPQMFQNWMRHIIEEENKFREIDGEFDFDIDFSNITLAFNDFESDEAEDAYNLQHMEQDMFDGLLIDIDLDEETQTQTLQGLEEEEEQSDYDDDDYN